MPGGRVEPTGERRVVSTVHELTNSRKMKGYVIVVEEGIRAPHVNEKNKERNRKRRDDRNNERSGRPTNWNSRGNPGIGPLRGIQQAKSPSAFPPVLKQQRKENSHDDGGQEKRGWRGADAHHAVDDCKNSVERNRDNRSNRKCDGRPEAKGPRKQCPRNSQQHSGCHERERESEPDHAKPLRRIATFMNGVHQKKRGTEIMVPLFPI